MILLIILLLLLVVFWGGWGGPRYWSGGGAYAAWGPLFLLIVVLLILWAAGVVHAEPVTATTATGALLFGAVDPTPVAPPPNAEHDRNVTLRWYAMVAAWLLSLVAGAIGVIQKIGWGALGIGDIAANWLLVIAGICLLIGGGLSSFPTFPDAARLRAERTLHWDRKAARMQHMHLTDD